MDAFQVLLENKQTNQPTKKKKQTTHPNPTKQEKLY